MDLLERERCLADLTAWLGAAAERGGCIALVGGEAGIGKTSLMHEFAEQQREVRVLWGACDALFTPRPLAPLHDIARQTQGALVAAINSGARTRPSLSVSINASVVWSDRLRSKPAIATVLK